MIEEDDKLIFGREERHVLFASAALKSGELVVFPTETVYGLGADATNQEAVEKIFRAKGRPRNNPLICHVLDVDQAEQFSESWTLLATRLAREFWPGPLSIIMPKGPEIADAVTAGGPGVAFRCPGHAVALDLLKAFGRPIAAPSANKFTEVSPTKAHHALKLKGSIACILNGGACKVGIESTVISLLEEPTILRLGPISVRQIESVLKTKVEVADSVKQLLNPNDVESHSDSPILSPGQTRRHYAPAVPLFLVTSLDDPEAQKPKTLFLISSFQCLRKKDERLVVCPYLKNRCVMIGWGADRWEHRLYSIFFEVEAGEWGDIERIVILQPGGQRWRSYSGVWGGVVDRILRASEASREENPTSEHSEKVEEGEPSPQ